MDAMDILSAPNAWGYPVNIYNMFHAKTGIWGSLELNKEVTQFPLASLEESYQCSELCLRSWSLAIVMTSIPLRI